MQWPVVCVMRGESVAFFVLLFRQPRDGFQERRITLSGNSVILLRIERQKSLRVTF